MSNSDHRKLVVIYPEITVKMIQLSRKDLVHLIRIRAEKERRVM